MEKITAVLKFGVVAVVAWWAGLHGVYKLLMALQVLDVISGVLVATGNHTLSSALGMVGIRRKAYTWLILFGLGLIQVELGSVLDVPELITGYGPAELAAAAFGFMEFVSIIENSEALGVPLPRWLRESLASVREKLGYQEGD